PTLDTALGIAVTATLDTALGIAVTATLDTALGVPITATLDTALGVPITATLDTALGVPITATLDTALGVTPPATLDSALGVAATRAVLLGVSRARPFRQHRRVSACSCRGSERDGGRQGTSRSQSSRCGQQHRTLCKILGHDDSFPMSRPCRFR
ncbi:hypothetical protein, partial [Streptomyces sp. NPDC058254]|uniref:hypothetical protein n=1 Tax=Streptomyces sp. NPDC058254 TaxID=3346406 RepID=UPI0036E5CE5C